MTRQKHRTLRENTGENSRNGYRMVGYGQTWSTVEILPWAQGVADDERQILLP